MGCAIDNGSSNLPVQLSSRLCFIYLISYLVWVFFFFLTLLSEGSQAEVKVKGLARGVSLLPASHPVRAALACDCAHRAVEVGEDALHLLERALESEPDPM